MTLVNVHFRWSTRTRQQHPPGGFCQLSHRSWGEEFSQRTPYTLNPTHYTLHTKPTHYTLHTSHYNIPRGATASGRFLGRGEKSSHCVHPTPYTLHRRPYTLHLRPYTLHPTPYTLHLRPYTLHLRPYTLHLRPYTLHRRPYTLHPTPYTLNPKP